MPSDTLLVKVEHTKDTLFVYQHVKLGQPGVECLQGDRCTHAHHDGVLRLREVYVARKDTIQLIDVQKAIYQAQQSAWIYQKNKSFH